MSYLNVPQDEQTLGLSEPHGRWSEEWTRKQNQQVVGLMRMRTEIFVHCPPQLCHLGEGGEDLLEASVGHGHPCFTFQGWVTT